MDLKRTIAIAAMWAVVVIAACFGQTYWTKMYGGKGDDEFYAVQPLSDGTVLIAGRENTSGAGGWDGWLVKIKPGGDTLWTKTYGGTEYDEFSLIQPVGDGNFLVAGHTESFGTGNDHGWLLKIKPDGDTLWAKTYGGEFSAVCPSGDGNFLLAGSTFTDGIAKKSGWLAKINPDGDTLWTKTYGVADFSFGYFSAIRPADDGHFLLGGCAEPGNSQNWYAWLVNIKPDGNAVWAKTYPGDSNSAFFAIQSAGDGNLLIAGSSQVNGMEDNDGWLVKIEANGDTIWTKKYARPRNDYFSALQPASDGNFLILGSTHSLDTVKDSGFLVKIKPDGNLLWTKTYGGAREAAFRTIQPAINGGFLIGGSSRPSGVFSDNGWIICILPDQYAHKDSLFSYKIPTYGGDTLNYGYAPFTVPAGMTVSPGGTVSWTPNTDSVYMDHAEFIVVNDAGRKDTLSFNIFDNTDCHAPVKKSRPRTGAFFLNPFDIVITSLPGKVRFSLRSPAVCIYIYDISGRIVDRITPVAVEINGGAAWPKDAERCHAGQYFAKAVVGNHCTVKQFMVVP